MWQCPRCETINEDTQVCQVCGLAYSDIEKETQWAEDKIQVETFSDILDKKMEPVSASSSMARVQESESSIGAKETSFKHTHNKVDSARKKPGYLLYFVVLIVVAILIVLLAGVFPQEEIPETVSDIQAQTIEYNSLINEEDCVKIALTSFYGELPSSVQQYEGNSDEVISRSWINQPGLITSFEADVDQNGKMEQIALYLDKAANDEAAPVKLGMDVYKKDGRKLTLKENYSLFPFDMPDAESVDSLVFSVFLYQLEGKWVLGCTTSWFDNDAAENVDFYSYFHIGNGELVFVKDLCRDEVMGMVNEVNIYNPADSQMKTYTFIDDADAYFELIDSILSKYNPNGTNEEALCEGAYYLTDEESEARTYLYTSE